MIKEIKQYEIFLVNLDPTVGKKIKKTRPAVVISPFSMNNFLGTIVVCPMTTSIHPRWRSRIQTICARKKAEIAIDQIRAISKKRIVKKIDCLKKDEALQVRQVITEMYGES